MSDHSVKSSAARFEDDDEIEEFLLRVDPESYPEPVERKLLDRDMVAENGFSEAGNEDYGENYEDNEDSLDSSENARIIATLYEEIQQVHRREEHVERQLVAMQKAHEELLERFLWFLS